MAKNKLYKADSSEYDTATAKYYKMKPGKNKHMGSVAPSGQVLKGRQHPTYYLHKKEEAMRGSTTLKFGGVEYVVGGSNKRKKDKGFYGHMKVQTLF